MTTFPQVSVTAIANGSEVGGIPAVFRFSRTGPTTEALSVNYRLRGTAQPTVDYDGYFSGTIDFSQGASTADLRLAGRADTPTALGSAYTLLAADITNGFAEVPTGTLSNGTTYTFNAKVIDNAGNASAASTNLHHQRRHHPPSPCRSRPRAAQLQRPAGQTPPGPARCQPDRAQGVP